MGARLDNNELYLFNTGASAYAYRSLGCHKVALDGHECFRFAVWAPHAKAVSVVGDFNGWNAAADPMHPCGTSGVWEAHIGIIEIGGLYKYAITTQSDEMILKADPFAFYSELRPGTASVVWDIGGYPWKDEGYMAARKEARFYSAPMSIYEVHAQSWKQGLGFCELADTLIPYVKEMGYTHIELMPVTEFPYDGSWGYQVTGYFSISSRFGTPQDFMYFVDCCHQAGLGVILDWVPAHFTRDDHGLRRFDGAPLFEYTDARKSDQPGWGTLIFDYGKAEVQSFLVSGAVFLLEEFHVDALRVDAVSCMLYLDYGRKPGQWLPNIYGGRENLEAIGLLRKLTDAVHAHCPGALLIAEESSSFPYLTTATEHGGLGFDLKWNMGWMNDTLSYMSRDSIYRKHHHDALTFPMCYAFSERHVLPLSHDEVVHGKCSLIGRMAGAYEEKFHQLRLLYMYQFAHPGKKLMFMGCEFAQFIEWAYQSSLDWLLLDYPAHRDMRIFVRELNLFYRKTPPLFENDQDWGGFEWIRVDDWEHSVIAFVRSDNAGNRLLCVFNFTPMNHPSYRLRLSGVSRIQKVLSNVDLRRAKPIKSKKDGEGACVDIPILPYEGAYYALESGEREA